MERKRLYDNAILVAPRENRKALLSYRAEHPDQNFSIVSVEDIESAFLLHHDDRLLIELIREGYGYHEAKEIANVLDHMKEGNFVSKKLQKLLVFYKKYRESGLLFPTVYPERTFSKKKYVIHGYRIGKRISEALSEMENISCFWDEAKLPRENYPEVHRFEDAHAELHYLANRVARLIDDGVNPESIVIIGLDPALHFELSFVAETYGFSVNIPSDESLAKTRMGARFLSLHKSGVAVEEALKQVAEEYPDDPDLGKLSLAVKTFLIPSLSKERQHEVYVGLLLEEKASKPRLEGAVKLSSSYFFDDDAHVFLASFCLNKAPRIHRDGDYLSDEEKVELGLPTSLDLNKRDREELLALLKSPQIEAITYAERQGENSFYPSPLITNDGLLKFAESNELPYEYSYTFASLWLSHLKDRDRKYGFSDQHIAPLEKAIDLDYMGYDPCFKPYNGAKNQGPLSLSPSSAEKYFKCPFQYYLNKVLGIEDGSSTFTRRIGNIYHSVLQHLYDPDFDPEVAFENALSKEIEENGPLTPSETLLLRRLKKRLFSAIEIIQANEKRITCPRFDTEQHLSYEISKGQTIHGFADKIILSGERQENVSIVDFKTYGLDFDEGQLPYGASIQLPTYALLASHTPQYQDKNLLGFFLQNILPASKSHDEDESEEETLEKAMQLKGIFLADVEAISTLDSNCRASTYIKGSSVTQNGSFRQGKSPKSKEQIEALIETATEKYKEGFAAIAHGEFPIRPLAYKKGKMPCELCGLADICYHRASMTFRVGGAKDDQTEVDDG